VTAERDAYLDAVLLGGREPVVVTIVEYDESWPARFEELAGRIRRALGGVARSVEHIGSTAVPGLAAKPIVDVLLTVDDVADEGSYVPALHPLGFALRVREPDHRMLRTAARDVPPARLRAGPGGGARLPRPAGPAARGRAGPPALRRDEAGFGWAGVAGHEPYADAKNEVVAAVLSRARTERS